MSQSAANSSNSTDSFGLVSESADDELRYFLTVSKGLLRQRLRAASKDVSFDASIAKLKILEEMIVEQLPGSSGSNIHTTLTRAALEEPK